MQMTVVNSLQTMLAYLAGTGEYRSIGIVPVADRSPIGANLAYFTTLAASFALLTCGTMIDWAPPSNAREIQSEVLAGTRTIGVSLSRQLWGHVRGPQRTQTIVPRTTVDSSSPGQMTSARGQSGRSRTRRMQHIQ